MARPNKEQWTMARAEYEVRGSSLAKIAKTLGIDRAAVSRRAKNEGWKQGKFVPHVDARVEATKTLSRLNEERDTMPPVIKYTVDDVVKLKLQAELAFADFEIALLQKGKELLGKTKTIQEFETMSRGHRNISPTKPATTVQVNQQQAVTAPPLSPRDALAEIVRQATAGNPTCD